MEKKCNSYETIERLCYTPFCTNAYYKTVGICNGTRERDECSCDGDRTKCDFYPDVREKAIQEEDSLIVTYDHCSPDVPTLCITRKDGNKVKVLNTIQGDVAFGMYHYLTGGAELKNIKDIPKKPIGEFDSVPHYRCPTCNRAVVMYCDNHKYPCCQWCGQALDWK